MTLGDPSTWREPCGGRAALATFVSRAIAGSVVPTGGEVAAAAAGLPPVPLVVVASIGNTLGACANRCFGREGANWWRRSMPWRLEPATGKVGGGAPSPATGAERGTRERVPRLARRWIEEWGAPVMVLSWLPVVGDPLTLMAGVARVPFLPFVAWVAVGKATRYLVVVGATGAVAEAFGW